MILDRRTLVLTGAAALAPGLALGQQQPLIRAPFDKRGGRITTRVDVGRIGLNGMLDSGGAFHVIDRAVAERIGLLANGEEVRVRGVGGVLRGRYSAPIDLTVGGKVLSSRLAVLDLTAMGRTGVDVIVGGPAFHTYAVDLDFTGDTFAFAPRSPVPGGRVSVPLTPVEEWMTAPLTISGQLVQATIDLGTDVPVVLSPKAARRLNITERNTTSAPLGGVGGQEIGRITSAPQVVFARQAFVDVPIQVAAKDLGTEANIGLALLSRFDLWVDFGGKLLLAKPNGRAGASFDRNLHGFYGSPEGDAIRVSHVAKGGPAEEAGLKRGDVITTIDGQPAAAANAALTGAAEGRVLNLTLDDGQTRSLTLKRYY